MLTALMCSGPPLSITCFQVNNDFADRKLWAETLDGMVKVGLN